MMMNPLALQLLRVERDARRRAAERYLPRPEADSAPADIQARHRARPSLSGRLALAHGHGRGRQAC